MLAGAAHLSRRMLSVHAVSAWKDNFMYIIGDDVTKQAAIVDAVEPDKIIQAVKDKGYTVESVLTTHHHADHSSGNEPLSHKVKVPFYGGDDRIPALTNKISHKDSFKIGNLNVECLFTPCHTTGHICYYVTDDNGQKAVFTGDTLFIGGCGRFFEGTAEQMHHALNTVLAGLPDDTKVYCGHEYTVQNLKFVANIDPNNAAVSSKLQWAQNQIKQGIATIPSTIGEEKTFNPFMRVGEPNLQTIAKTNNPVEIMQYLREAKNRF